MRLGPVQVLVVGTSAEPDGAILAELDRLAEAGIVHLIDLVVVRRLHEDAVDTLPAPAQLHPGLGRIAEEFLAKPGFASEPDDAAGLSDADPGGAAASADDAGSDDGARTWSLLDAVAVGQTAVIALIEHLWAVPLRAAMQAAEAVPLGESWLGPADLADLEAIVARRDGAAP